MNKPQHQLQVTVAECLQSAMSGLNEKHAKKLQKAIASVAKKLVRKYAKLEAKEQKGHKKVKAVAAQPAPKKARGAQKKAAPVQVAAGA